MLTTGKNTTKDLTKAHNPNKANDHLMAFDGNKNHYKLKEQKRR